ncbi:cellulose binding domain-containing protein [Nonomuraea sp. NPDC049784]|uniref:cellulose binding domain-containing protein n=1 Tax=Nonomuraea sp. NPDC049784 TaxID=3154361 RepID=UPI0033D7ADB2
MSTPTSSSDGACAATYRTTNSWSGGDQYEVMVTVGTSAIDGWTVRWNPSTSQTISRRHAFDTVFTCTGS